VQDVLTALAKLARIDEAAQGIEQELRELPVSIEEMSASVQTLESALQVERDQKAEAEAVRQTQRDDLTARQDSLARARTKANQARNVKEMNASEREVDTNRRLIKEREEEAAKLDEALSVFDESLSDHENKLSEFRQMYEKDRAAADERIQELQVERDKALAGRETFAALIPVPLVRRYERLREARGTGVAMAETAACPACRVFMSAQVFNELQRGTEAHQCSSCNRFLIWTGWLDQEPEPQAEDAAEESVAALEGAASEDAASEDAASEDAASEDAADGASAQAKPVTAPVDAV